MCLRAVQHIESIRSLNTSMYLVQEVQVPGIWYKLYCLHGYAIE